MSNFIFSEAKISPINKVNATDLKKIARDTLIFFAPVILIWLSQLQGQLNNGNFATLKELAPNAVTMGAIYGWALGIATNFFLKLRKESSK